MNYKKCIIPAILLFLFSACESQQTQEKEISVEEFSTEQLINEIDLHALKILVIDKCEYIFYKKSIGTNTGFGFMAHKGNCNNPIHFYSRSLGDHD